jgi:hypothetical protein
MALLAVFAVFAGNLQRTRPRSPQKSWADDPSTEKITAGVPAVFVCSGVSISLEGTELE